MSNKKVFFKAMRFFEKIQKMCKDGKRKEEKREKKRNEKRLFVVLAILAMILSFTTDRIHHQTKLFSPLSPPQPPPSPQAPT